MNALKGGAAALAYSAILAALTVMSGRMLPLHGICSDVSILGHVQARTSLGSFLPVPVVQLCSGERTAAVLVLGIIAASCAWAALMRLAPQRWVIAACMGAGILGSLCFPYVATTDPYAYAVYGYEALLGQNPYTVTEARAKARSDALDELYSFFPSGSVDRTANYGPLAVLEYREIASVSGDSLRRFILLARVTNAGLVLVLAWLLMRLRAPGTSRLQSAFIAFHPLVLVESVAFIHGDILMLILLCAALAAYRKHAIEICAVLIVLATEVRSIAGLALVVLVMKAAQEQQPRIVGRALAASCATAAFTWALAVAGYGTFTLGASPALGPYTSPLLLAFNAAGANMQLIRLGGAFQALTGLAILAWVLLRRRYEYVGFAALTVLPIVRAWYCQWLLPLLAIDQRSNVKYAAAALAGIGIVTEWPEMTGHSDALTWSVILCLQWIPPVVAIAVPAMRSRKPLSRAPSPATSAP